MRHEWTVQPQTAVNIIRFNHAKNDAGGRQNQHPSRAGAWPHTLLPKLRTESRGRVIRWYPLGAPMGIHQSGSPVDSAWSFKGISHGVAGGSV